MAGKKKATMTLKDFHGGSIPSDPPLPSAPGLSMRSMDRPVFERPGLWGSPMGRSDHRLRPGSAGSVRNNFDKTPFLGPNAHIGCNFDEDERKPLDGGPGPRRVVSDDSICPFPSRGEVTKSDYSVSFRQPPSQQFSSVSPNSYAGRASEAVHGGTGSKFGGNGGSVNPGPYPNVWAMRKEVVGVAELPSATWSGPDAATKLAHASALDKVSSGRWQSTKQPIHHPAHVEPIRHSEIERSYHSADVARDMEYQEAMLARQVEWSLAVDDGILGGRKEIPSYEKVRSPLYPDKIENISHSGNTAGLVTPSPAPSEQPERSKLKLLPRSRPLDNSEPPIDHNQGYHQPQNYDLVLKVTEPYETVNHLKSGLTLADSGNLAVERPKLNMKPRSQAFEQVEETTEKERKTIFGGARPRELVLKERGVDNIVVNNHGVVQPPNRVNQDLPRTETVSLSVTSSRYNGKPEGAPLDNWTKNNSDKRDNRVDAERTDTQKRNWRSENQRNAGETGIKHQSHHQLQLERPPSSETWRKPIEEPKPASSNGTGLRYGKAASAVELAQAFSKSVSDPKTVDRFPNQAFLARPRFLSPS